MSSADGLYVGASPDVQSVGCCHAGQTGIDRQLRGRGRLRLRASVAVAPILGDISTWRRGLKLV